MPVSLEQLSREVGDARRALVTANAGLQAAIGRHQGTRSQLANLREKIGANQPTAEQQTELAGLESAHESARTAMMSASDNVQRVKSDLSDLEGEMTMLQSSNALDDHLRSSTGSVTLGGDGESLGGRGGVGLGLSRPQTLKPDRSQMEHHLGVFLQSKMIAGLDRTDPSAIAKDHFNNEYVASTMAAGDHSKGGSMVFGQFADFFIELLAQKAICRSIGIATMEAEGGLTIPKMTSGITGAYKGEREDATVEDIGTGDVTLLPKELWTMVAVSEQLLRKSSINASTYIRNEMLRAAAALEDRAFLRGAASGAGPTGLRWRAGHVVPFVVSGGVTATKVINFLANLELRLQQANVPMDNCVWLTNYQVVKFLETLVNANGIPLFPEVKDGRINKYPFRATNHIPANLAVVPGTGNAAPTVGYTEIMLIDASCQMIGEGGGISLKSSDSATYVQGGQTVNAFQRGDVVFRYAMSSDIQTRYQESIAVGVDVEWPLV
jgi:HK97 family phage major capsid protein